MKPVTALSFNLSLMVVVEVISNLLKVKSEKAIFLTDILSPSDTAPSLWQNIK